MLDSLKRKMMRNQIFLSHAHEDKDIVDEIAEEIRKIYGQNRVFYDSWSMKPGDSLIGGINKGLENCAFFFLFMSETSLRKPMVRLEWHNALITSLKDQTCFIPIRVNNINPPAILVSTIYIDMYNRGLTQTIEDMKLLIDGKGQYDPDKVVPYQNITTSVEKLSNQCIKITVSAKKLIEPVNRIGIYASSGRRPSIVGMSQITSCDIEKNGVPRHVFIIDLLRPMTPGNSQEYDIRGIEEDLDLEVYHFKTSSSIQLLYESHIKMS
jgi:hypothetical protein